MEIKDDFKKIINMLVGESEKESKELISDVVENLKKIGIESPEKFNIMFGYKIETGLKEIVKTLHKIPLDEIKNKGKPDFIYLKYNYLSRNIENLCIEKEKTSCCSVDKSRFILNMYFNYSITGAIPKFNPEEEQYWTPNFGTYEEWINYCDGLYELYYGNPGKYLKSLKTLIDSEIRKYKHILHTWYIKFADESVIEFVNTWDDNIEDP